MMATASNPATTNHSPRYSGGDGHNSPQSRRSTRAPSPWSQIVRGESESVPAVPSSPSAVGLQEQVSSSDSLSGKVVSSASSSDDPATEAPAESSENGNNNAAKKPAWNKPSNAPPVEVGPVMGAASWPALSESARATPKSSSDSLKVLSDGSVPALQGIGVGNASPSSSLQKPAISNANSNSTLHHGVPARQKSLKRFGSSGGSAGAVIGSLPANGGVPQSPPQGPVGEVSHNNSHRDHTQRSTNWDNGPRGPFVSQPQAHGGNDHPQQQRNSFRRGSGGPHSRGDGSYNHNYGGRRDHDRGNHDWNTNRGFNGNREGHMQPQRGFPRSFIRTPLHNTPPFIGPPPPVRPFGSPMGFPELTPPLYYVPAPPPDPLRPPVPFVAPITPHPMFFPAHDPQLHSNIVTQIDYYFSNENLVKDTYLRSNMDEQGWVPISLIAGFNRVQRLTDNVQLILDLLQVSTVVEVQGDKIRRRNDWVRWIMPPVAFPSVPSSPSLGSSTPDALASRIQGVALEENSTSLSRSSSLDLNSQSHPSNGEGTSGQAASDPLVSGKNSGI